MKISCWLTCLFIFLATTCVGTEDNSKYISELDKAYLQMATWAQGVTIDGVIENEIPRESVVDSQYFANKKFKLFEIYNTDTTCVVPYKNYIYIVDFFGSFHEGDKIRYNDFVQFSPFRGFRRDSDITYEWNGNMYQYYWMEHAYIRKPDAQRVLDESVVVKTKHEEDTEDDEDEEEDDDE